MQYRKKPVVITAIQLTLSSIELVNEFLGITGKGSFNDCGYGIDPETGSFKITTPEGVMVANIGDWITKDVNGEFYPCKPDIFEKTYETVEIEPCDCDEAPQSAYLDFGLALRFLKAGRKVARAGWNGKGMWLAYSPGSKKLPANKFWAGPNRDYANTMSEQCADVLPCITMKTATGEILMGWLASQTDMLANDWQVVE